MEKFGAMNKIELFFEHLKDHFRREFFLVIGFEKCAALDKKCT